MSGNAIDQGPKVRSSRVLATQFHGAQDRADARERAAAHADILAPAILDDPAPVVDRDPQTDLTLVEADVLGLVTAEQLRTLKQFDGTAEHATPAARIRDIAQGKYNRQRLWWPRCAPGPSVPRSFGLLIPNQRSRATRRIWRRRPTWGGACGSQLAIVIDTTAQAVAPTVQVDLRKLVLALAAGAMSLLSCAVILFVKRLIESLDSFKSEVAENFTGLEQNLSEHREHVEEELGEVSRQVQPVTRGVFGPNCDNGMRGICGARRSLSSSTIGCS